MTRLVTEAIVHVSLLRPDHSRPDLNKKILKGWIIPTLMLKQQQQSAYSRRKIIKLYLLSCSSTGFMRWYLSSHR